MQECAKLYRSGTYSVANKKQPKTLSPLEHNCQKKLSNCLWYLPGIFLSISFTGSVAFVSGAPNYNTNSPWLKSTPKMPSDSTV